MSYIFLKHKEVYHRNYASSKMILEGLKNIKFQKTYFTFISNDLGAGHEQFMISIIIELTNISLKSSLLELFQFFFVNKKDIFDFELFISCINLFICWR